MRPITDLIMTDSSVLNEIDRFLKTSRMSPATFGQKAVHDWRLVDRLRKGGEVLPRTEKRILAFISSYDGKVIPRPHTRRVA